MLNIDEITDGIYRISAPPTEYPITFNQFLIDDEQPTLIHTGVYDAYDDIRKAIGQVLDPARLANVVLLHFEGDECGGMERFVAEAPQARLVASGLSAGLNLTQFGFPYLHRVPRVLDGGPLHLGGPKLRFWGTPPVRPWDSMMVVEESPRSLFPSDLFIQPGDQPAVVTENLGAEMCAYYREIGIFAHEDPVRRVVDRIGQPDPRWVQGMQGGTPTPQSLPYYVDALRNEPFGFQGKSLGREIPASEPAAVSG